MDLSNNYIVTIKSHGDKIIALETDVTNIKSFVGLTDIEKFNRKAELRFKDINDPTDKKLFVQAYIDYLQAFKKQNIPLFSKHAYKILEKLVRTIIPKSIFINDFYKIITHKKAKDSPYEKLPLYITIFGSGNEKRKEYEETITSHIEKKVLPWKDNIYFLDLVKLACFKYMYEEKRCIGREFFIVSNLNKKRQEDAHLKDTVQERNTINELYDVTEIFLDNLIPHY